MTWILVNALNNGVARALHDQWKREQKKVSKKSILKEKLFVRRIHFKTYIMHNNGEVLAYLAKLKMLYGELVQLYIIDTLDLKDMPEEVVRVAKYLTTRPKKSVEVAVKNTPEVNYNMEVLRKCRIEYSKNLKRRPYTLQEIRALSEQMVGALKEAEK